MAQCIALPEVDRVSKQQVEGDEGTYLFLGQIDPIVGVLRRGGVVQLFFETCKVLWSKSDAECYLLVWRCQVDCFVPCRERCFSA